MGKWILNLCGMSPTLTMRINDLLLYMNIRHSLQQILSGWVSVAPFLNPSQFPPTTEMNLHISLLVVWQDFCFCSPTPQFFEIVFACGT